MLLRMPLVGSLLEVLPRLGRVNVIWMTFIDLLLKHTHNHYDSLKKKMEKKTSHNMTDFSNQEADAHVYVCNDLSKKERFVRTFGFAFLFGVASSIIRLKKIEPKKKHIQRQRIYVGDRSLHHFFVFGVNKNKKSDIIKK